MILVLFLHVAEDVPVQFVDVRSRTILHACAVVIDLNVE
jgi:hypothetical protein